LTKCVFRLLCASVATDGGVACHTERCECACTCNLSWSYGTTYWKTCTATSQSVTLL